MRPEDKVRLQHILDEADEACKYAKDISFEEFLKDGKTARAIIRSVEVIGGVSGFYLIASLLRSSCFDILWANASEINNSCNRYSF